MLLISVPTAPPRSCPDAGLTGNDIEDLVTIDFVAFVVHHNDPIAIAIVGNTQIGFFRQHARLQGTNVRRPDLFIDVEAIRLTAHRDNLSAQLAENIRRNVIGRAVSAVDHHFKALRLSSFGKVPLQNSI
jgi:hypothetical protein